MKSQKLGRIWLPSLRAKMGDWIYYISYMKMKDISWRVKYADEIHKSRTLNDLLQRRLTDRSKAISEYLLKQEQRFFNTIIIGVYGGSPDWYELGINRNKYLNPDILPDDIGGSIGFLSLSGKETLFAIDGQHRVAGIKSAIKKNKQLEREEVSVIFVHAITDVAQKEQVKRTRRLFSTLNRYAKPVSKRDIIALDEDDCVAIITRQLLDEYQLFSGDRINTKVAGKSIPKNDQSSITTLVALYDALNIILKDKIDSKWNDFLTLRPEDKVIDSYFNKAIQYFDYLQSYSTELKKIVKKKHRISKYRHQNGGHLLFRPIGLLLISQVVKLLQINGFSLRESVRRVTKAKLELSKPPWTGLLWEAGKKRIISRKENQKVASELLYYMIGGDLSKLNTNRDELLNSYASAVNWDEAERGQLKLPRRLRLRK